jgi:hypothetical protein
VTRSRSALCPRPLRKPRKRTSYAGMRPKRNRRERPALNSRATSRASIGRLDGRPGTGQEITIRVYSCAPGARLGIAGVGVAKDRPQRAGMGEALEGPDLYRDERMQGHPARQERTRPWRRGGRGTTLGGAPTRRLRRTATIGSRPLR